MLGQLLTVLLITISAFATINPTIYTYKTVNNLPITAAVYIPPVRLHKTYPVILAIHAGGFVEGDATTFALSDQESNEILKRGWLIVSINYRLSPSAFLSDMVEDVQDAFNWIRNDLVKIIAVNPNAIAVWGHSAGGGFALIAGYKVSPRPKAIIALYPQAANFTQENLYNPRTQVSERLVSEANKLREPIAEYSSDNDNPRHRLLILAKNEQKSGWLLTTADPYESPENILKVLREYSAVYNIDSDFPPTYLAHGLADKAVPASQSIEMEQGLRNKQIVCQLNLLPGAGHAFNSQEIWKGHIERVFDFVAPYITE